MVRWFVLLTTSILGGCASGMNVINGENYQAPKMVYGGARLDADLIGHGVDQAIHLEPEKQTNPNPRLDAVMLATTGMLDLPFALVADTCTLPMTCYAAYLRLQEKPPKPEKKRSLPDVSDQEKAERMPGVEVPVRTVER